MKSPNLFPSHCLDAGKSCFIRVAKPACVGRCMVYVRGTGGGLINTLIKSVGGGSLLFQITEVSFLCGVVAVKSQLSHPSPFLLPSPASAGPLGSRAPAPRCQLARQSLQSAAAFAGGASEAGPRPPWLCLLRIRRYESNRRGGWGRAGSAGSLCKEPHGTYL